MESNLLPFAGVLITMLLAGNIYFVKRLITKIDETSLVNAKLSSLVSKLSESVGGLGNQLREIKSDIKDLRRLEIEVAVLKSHLNPPSGGQNLKGGTT